MALHSEAKIVQYIVKNMKRFEPEDLGKKYSTSIVLF